jgi:hypothetical protein
MSMKPSFEFSSRVRVPRPSGVVLLLAAMLLVFSAILAWQGFKAVESKHLELEWNSRSSFGIGFFSVTTRESHGVAIYEGREAVRMGAGYASGALMLLLWAVGLVWRFVSPRLGGESTWSGRVLAWLSLMALLVFLVCIYPPWRAYNFLFLPVLALPTVLAFFVPGGITRRVAASVFISLIGTAILLEQFYPGRGFDIVMDILAGMILLVHLVAISPRLEERALAGR